VSAKPGSNLASWGAPVDAKTAIAPGTPTFDLKDAKGSAVLLWITHLANESSNQVVRIAEVTAEN